MSARACVVAATVVFASGCIAGSSATECIDGTVCPRGTVCDPAGGCAPAGQASACDGLAEGVACEFLGVAGACSEGLCRTDVCGNGVRDPAEECDCGDGAFLPAGCAAANADSGAATCRTDCTSHCGDGQRGDFEDCDIGVLPDGFCVDAGFDRGALTCGSACTATTDDCSTVHWGRNDIPGLFQTYQDLAVLEDGQMFAVGNSFQTSSASHFDGQTWRTELFAAGSLLTVVARAADDVFAMGTSGLGRHYDGQRWTDISLGFGNTVQDSWTDGTEVLIAGDGGIHRYSGGAWVLEAMPIATAIGGTLPAALFAAPTFDLNGQDFVFRRLPDSSGQWWSGNLATVDYFHPVSQRVLAITAAGGSVYIVGESGYAARWNVATKVFDDLPAPTSLDLTYAWGGDGGLYAANATEAFHFDGEHWAELALPSNNEHPDEEPNQIFALGGVGSVPALLAGPNAIGVSVFQHQGTLLSPIDEPRPSAPVPAIADVFVADRGHAFMVGSEGFVVVDNGVDQTVSQIAPADVTLQAVWGDSRDDVYAAGQSAAASVLLRYNGAAWTDVPLPANPTGSTQILDIGGTGAHLFVLRDGGTVSRLERATGLWADVSRGDVAEQLVAVTTFGSDVAILLNDAAGDAVVYSLADSGWTELFAVDGAGTALYGAALDDIHVGLSDGRLVHFRSGAVESFDTARAITHLHGTGSADVFAVSADREVHHFDGRSWSPVKLPRLAYFRVFATADTVQFADALGFTMRLVRTVPW